MAHASTNQSTNQNQQCQAILLTAGRMEALAFIPG
jgi:hypothetical protein